MTFVDFHLVVPGEMSVSAAHAICDRIEQAVRADLDHALIPIYRLATPVGSVVQAGIN